MNYDLKVTLFMTVNDPIKLSHLIRNRFLILIFLHMLLGMYWSKPYGFMWVVG